MKNISEVILEALRSSELPEGFTTFNKYQKAAIEKALRRKGTRIEFKGNGKGSINEIDFTVIPDRYPKVEAEYTDPDDGRLRRSSGQFFVYDDGISAGMVFDLKNKSYNCKLINFTYNDTKDHTLLVFDLSGSVLNDWKYMYGQLYIYLKGNCLTPAIPDVKFDGKKYVEFMKKYLSKKEDYLRAFDWDEEILDCYAELQKKDTIYIELHLETDKGYSSHHHSADYNFEHNGSSYICKRELYDRDHEAQLVRKFRAGIAKFIGSSAACPRFLNIHIEQQLD